MMKNDDSKYIIGTKQFVFDGKVYEYPLYDTSTPEGWRAWVKAKAGSITDETFVRPTDFYQDFYNKYKDEVLSR